MATQRPPETKYTINYHCDREQMKLYERYKKSTSFVKLEIREENFNDIICECGILVNQQEKIWTRRTMIYRYFRQRTVFKQMKNVNCSR